MPSDRRRIVQQFESAFDNRPEVLSEAPGRVNLIGEHTDYAGGFVLPAAIDRTVVAAAAPRSDRKVRVHSAVFNARDEWQVDAPRRTGRSEWRDYVRGVAWALLDSSVGLRGADVLIDGDVPVGAGLSSSAALELAAAGALCAVSGVEAEPKRLAFLAQRAENDFVGVPCGIMDQLASALGRAGQAILIDCGSLHVEHVPLQVDEHGLSVVIVDSRVSRPLAETPYGQRRQECEAAARALGVASLRDAAPDEANLLPEPLNRRARHVICENRRVLDFVSALRSGDAEALGRLMNESHESLRYDFEVSCPELDLLVALALEVPGTLGTRLTGAGFGGCTVSLVRSAAIDTFTRTISDRYQLETGKAPAVYAVEPSDGLRVSHV